MEIIATSSRRGVKTPTRHKDILSVVGKCVEDEKEKAMTVKKLQVVSLKLVMFEDPGS